MVVVDMSSGHGGLVRRHSLLSRSVSSSECRSSSDSLTLPVGVSEIPPPAPFSGNRRPSNGFTSKKKGSSLSPSLAFTFLLLLSVVAVGGGYAVFRFKRSSLEAEWKTEKRNIEKQMKLMAKQIQTYQGSSKQQGNELVEYKSQMERAIQDMSKKRLLQKFGEGPYHVEIQLSFHPQSNVASMRGGDSFIIEMAPIEEMPHTVYWFLEQVDRQLWDGALFHRNAEHVVLGGPVANGKRFENSGFEKVLFQEHSHAFPHEEYTLGYAGRPGGPNFYVSVMDNTHAHGPGGQKGSDEADPCFAKVIKGFGAVDRMAESEVKEGSKWMKHNVNIVHMKVLPKGSIQMTG